MIQNSSAQINIHLYFLFFSSSFDGGDDRDDRDDRDGRVLAYRIIFQVIQSSPTKIRLP